MNVLFQGLPNQPQSGGNNFSAQKKIENFSFSMQAVLGRGTSGVVYKGQNDITGQSVAIKCVDNRLLTSEYAQGLIMSEIKIMKQLNHPNVVKLLTVVRTVNNTYIITELCSGGDLREYMRKKKQMPEAQALNIMSQIVAGIGELANHGFIHRDLKPANIMIHEGKFKLTDFGFAQKLESYEQQTMQSLVGTPLYMSPQILKKEKYTTKNDVYSAGLILYEMLYGDTPWPAFNIQALIQSIHTQPLSFQQEIQVSEDTKELIRDCLQLKEDDRISVEELVTHPVFEKYQQVMTAPSPNPIPVNMPHQQPQIQTPIPSPTLPPPQMPQSQSQPQIQPSSAQNIPQQNSSQPIAPPSQPPIISSPQNQNQYIQQNSKNLDQFRPNSQQQNRDNTGQAYTYNRPISVSKDEYKRNPQTQYRPNPTNYQEEANPISIQPPKTNTTAYYTNEGGRYDNIPRAPQQQSSQQPHHQMYTQATSEQNFSHREPAEVYQNKEQRYYKPQSKRGSLGELEKETKLGFADLICGDLINPNMVEPENRNPDIELVVRKFLDIVQYLNYVSIRLQMPNKLVAELSPYLYEQSMFAVCKLSLIFSNVLKVGICDRGENVFGMRGWNSFLNSNEMKFSLKNEIQQEYIRSNTLFYNFQSMLQSNVRFLTDLTKDRDFAEIFDSIPAESRQFLQRSYIVLQSVIFEMNHRIQIRLMQNFKEHEKYSQTQQLFFANDDRKAMEILSDYLRVIEIIQKNYSQGSKFFSSIQDFPLESYYHEHNFITDSDLYKQIRTIILNSFR